MTDERKLLEGWNTRHVARLTAFSMINTLIGGYVFMLGVGFIHGEWIHQLPTLGYWQAVAIVGVTRLVVSLVK